MKLPWYLRQKPAVALIAGLGGLFTVVNLACGQPWASTTAPTQPWKALAASADGTRLVAAANARGYFPGPPAPIYVSTNAGATWIQTSAPSNNWSSVACSADGLKLVAVSTPFVHNWMPPDFGDGLIHTSPDGGATWSTTSAPSNTWTSVASSADGIKLVAVAAPVCETPEWDIGQDVGEGAIYRSSDAGATWTRTSAPSNAWTSVASSADGTKLVALGGLRRGTNWDYIGEGAIYRSSDSGATWTQSSALNVNWSSVASSADGTKLLAAAGTHSDELCLTDFIYISTNSGATWSATTAPSNGWSAVASSADGTKFVALAAPDRGGGVYRSLDSGATWTRTGAPVAEWAAVACSADGYCVVAGGYRTSLYKLPYLGWWRAADTPATDWQDWESVACSADGTKLIAAEYSSGTYTSSDSGATWTPTTAPSNGLSSVASSADGAKLVALSGGHWDSKLPQWISDGAIYVSPDAGATWTRTSAPSNHWCSVASSADGNKLVATAIKGGVFTSSNAGADWTSTTAPTNGWSSVASSADGTKLLVVAAPFWDPSVANFTGKRSIYRSADAGATWTQTTAPTNGWSSVASSADGTKLVATAAPFWDPGVTNYVGDGSIYRSADAGATWRQTTAPTNGWTSVASSADGAKLVALTWSWASAGDGFGEVYVSTNSGVTWAPAGEPPAAGWWSAVTCSADGGNIVAVGNGLICSLRAPAPVPPLPPSPRLILDCSGAGLGLSWFVPSSRFVLQQSADLSPANWVDAPSSATLDFTNLHYRVTLTPSLSSRFYRLKH